MSDNSTDAQGRFGLEGAPDPEGETERPGAACAHDHAGAEGSTDHLASIYESDADRFAAAVPFLREGLERGERCLYVADDSTEAEVLEALREGGVDVDAALESGALTVHTKADTYLRTGEFDADAMLEFWEESLAEARDEEGYEGLRAAAEMTWALEEDGETGLDRLVEYEALLNSLYAGDDYVVLCQYDRERFPREVLSDVIRTHPLVVYDGTVCENFHYHPPEEFFEAEDRPLDVERTVEGLVSRARTKDALRERERQLYARLRQQEAVTELSQYGLEEPDLEDLFEEVTQRVGETLDADYCEVLEARSGGEELLLRAARGPDLGDDRPGEGAVDAARETQTGHTLRESTPVVVEDLPGDARFEGAGLPTDADVTSGVTVPVGSGADPWGVLGVHARERREFTDHDATFVRSVANTVATAIDRAERERFRRELYEITSTPDRSFEEKLRALFDLGCERFDLEVGGLARVDTRTDRFEVEYVGGDHAHLEPGVRVDLSETYCRVHSTAGEPKGVTDPDEAGFEDTLAYEEFGVRSYLGTRLSLENDSDRTLFFVSGEPRDRPFSETERTFCRLMGQWLQHELERREYERRLEESNERLEQFAYAASHDLQEPLRMVSSYLQLVEGRYADDLDADGREFVGYAVDGADRMREMIDGLLAYARVETHGDAFEPVDLGDVLADVREDMQVKLEESDAELAVEDLPTVEGDADQLRQVFQNLLDNAVEYSGEDPPRVRVDAERAGEEWLVSVADEGIGIDPEDQEQIFEVFQRLHSREEHEGTGIGLALCERIVERHGGRIWVDSQPGEGTTFSFTLPAP